MIETAILTPLEEELFALVNALEQFGFKKHKSLLGSLEIFEFHELNLLLALGGHGKTQFGVQSQYLLCQLPQVELLICAGAAGALSNELEIGDIVAATATVEHDYNLKFVNRPLPRFTGTPQVIDTLKQLPRTEWDFRLHFGLIASGDEDVVTVERGQELAYLTGCVAVAWEGVGGARSSQFAQKQYVELRGITDTANHCAAADFEVNLASAMFNLAKLIVRWQAAKDYCAV
ncbi:5'-methylthioadenosine/S-adenosylhomocysteine nucleosidase [Chamaesiphon minutus]|uniref:Nucleoside phosphorylase n=1 Tax=Chamaesiphon minutus (strain ATCC 27169 / PCC 6605) TaxID=1173020 RepID=K9URX4_CHAP6|nr:5'-methylthioadenosine/S-adenosylhomocysteine nucleosidase [Chamaesiphon minutus]AFY97024.1 nucleoside phosphorylase [Chamaesiphon minutus PCC 6605]